ncbi:MAG TPA: MarR family transcriptional regulator [Blastocatellia bacterium]|nr:MarR family transcriptional regulator [Blastocatellia bacterium]
MTRKPDPEVEQVLDRFAETMFRLMLDHHQRQAVEMAMTLPQAQALRLLMGGPRSTGDLAVTLRISAPAVTQLTDRLMRKHLIERQAADGDRRSVMIALTERGRRAVDSFRQRRHTVISGALDFLDDLERAQIVLALSKMVGALEQYEAERLAPASEARRRAVIARREPEAEQVASTAQTAPPLAAASKESSQWKTGNRTRKVRIEWD